MAAAMALMAGASKPCWECRRRRLLCDGTWPQCWRCTAAGIKCTGYEKDNRPLRWLQPGQVVSRGSPKQVRILALEDDDESQTSAEVELVPRDGSDELMTPQTMDIIDLDLKVWRCDINDAAEAAYYCDTTLFAVE